MSWRVGRKLGRTLYRGDTLIGMMDTPEDAAEVVAAINGTGDTVTDIPEAELAAIRELIDIVLEDHRFKRVLNLPLTDGELALLMLARVRIDHAIIGIPR